MYLCPSHGSFESDSESCCHLTFFLAIVLVCDGVLLADRINWIIIKVEFIVSFSCTSEVLVITWSPYKVHTNGCMSFGRDDSTIGDLGY